MQHARPTSARAGVSEGQGARDDRRRPSTAAAGMRRSKPGESMTTVRGTSARGKSLLAPTAGQGKAMARPQGVSDRKRATFKTKESTAHKSLLLPDGSPVPKADKEDASIW